MQDEVVQRVQIDPMKRVVAMNKSSESFSLQKYRVTPLAQEQLS